MEAPFHVQIAENRARLAVFLLLYLVLTLVTGWLVGLGLEPLFDGHSHFMRRGYGVWLPWQARPDDGPTPFLDGAVFKVMLAFLGASGAYFLYLRRHGRMMVLRLVEASVLRERIVQNTAEEIAIAAGMAKPPTVWVIEDASLNAFACSDSSGQSAVAVTRGLMEELDRDELQAVVAHEVAHLRNGDSRLMTLLFGVTRALDLVHWIVFRWLKVFAWVHRRAREEEMRKRDAKDSSEPATENDSEPETEDDPGGTASEDRYWIVDSRSSPVAASRSRAPHPAVARDMVLTIRHELETLHPLLFLLFLAVLLMASASFALILLGPVALLVLADRWELVALGVWMPLGLLVVRLAISRNREFQADMTAVELSRNPGALRRALAKLRDDPERPDRLTPSLAPLCIAPLARRKSGGTWATRIEEALYENGALDTDSRRALWRWVWRELPPHRQLMAVLFVPLATLAPMLWLLGAAESGARLFATHPPLDDRIQRLARAGG